MTMPQAGDRGTQLSPFKNIESARRGGRGADGRKLPLNIEGGGMSQDSIPDWE